MSKRQNRKQTYGNWAWLCSPDRHNFGVADKKRRARIRKEYSK